MLPTIWSQQLHLVHNKTIAALRVNESMVKHFVAAAGLAEYRVAI